MTESSQSNMSNESWVLLSEKGYVAGPGEYTDDLQEADRFTPEDAAELLRYDLVAINVGPKLFQLPTYTYRGEKRVAA